VLAHPDDNPTECGEREGEGHSERCAGAGPRLNFNPAVQFFHLFFDNGQPEPSSGKVRYDGARADPRPESQEQRLAVTEPTGFFL